MIKISTTTLILISLLTFTLKAVPSETLPVKRYAFIISSNSGGQDKPILRYAVKDARSFSDILTRMGNLRKDNTFFLVQPDPTTLFSNLEKLNSRIKSEKSSSGKVETIFYYSGHSDDKNLLIGNHKVSYRKFHNKIKNIDSDVKIAILDSCSSGSFNLLKGVKVKAPFLNNSAYDMKGYAFMTSSSPIEPSQESGELKGSIFTHYLVSGLSGAADLSGDSIITLNEAYQYAYRETLIHSQKTEHGPQHPGYNIQMSGKGDVIMTDIKQSPSTLVIDKEVSGRIFINNNLGNLIVEINKPRGKALSIGLEPDFYQVVLKKGNRSYKTSFNLSGADNHTINRTDFIKTPITPATKRGVSTELKHKAEYRFGVELYGGLSLFKADNFHKNITDTAAEFHYDVLSVNKGSFSMVNRLDSPDKINKISTAVPFGVRGKYYLTGSVAVSLGIEYMKSSKEANTDSLINIEGNTAEGYRYGAYYKNTKAPLKYSLSAFTFSAGVHLSRKITRDLEVEGYLLIGPSFIQTRYIFSLIDVWDLGEKAELNEKRSGVGFTAEPGLQLNYYFEDNLALFIGASYRLCKSGTLSDDGVFTLNGKKKNFTSPSKVPREYKLDLSGFSMKLGFQYRFK